MLTMPQLDYGNLGDCKEVVLEDDLLLDDSSFSNTPLQVAKKGDTVIIQHCLYYGLVAHPVHGLFRY